MPAVSAKNIAFVYAEDLWVADLDGKNPRRLTTDLGVESNPVFSPDGQTIAFSAQYDGNTDVYTIPLGGRHADAAHVAPRPGHRSRLHAGRQGRAVLLAAPRLHAAGYSQLFTVPLDGRHADAAADSLGLRGAAISPDGEYIAYTPVRDATAGSGSTTAAARTRASGSTT